MDKVARAEEHLRILHNELVAWRDSQPYRFSEKRNRDHTRFGIILEVVKEPSLTRWSLIASDCVHNLRSALDHLIYDIAVYETGLDPPPGERRLMFPIADNPADFRSLEKTRIKPLSVPVRAALERVQPYNRSHQALPPLLQLLREFDDPDKHRLLHLGFSKAVRGEFKNLGNLIEGQRMQMEMREIGLESGAEIAALILDRPSPEVYYEFVAQITIAVEQTAGPSGRTRTQLDGLLRLLCDEVQFVLHCIAAAVT